MLSPDVHVLIIPVTCEYITLLGKRNFADVIEIKNLEMGKIVPDYPDGPNIII